MIVEIRTRNCVCLGAYTLTLSDLQRTAGFQLGQQRIAQAQVKNIWGALKEENNKNLYGALYSEPYPS